MNSMPFPISLIDRRHIEAQLASALVKGYAAELGEERAVAVLGRVIEELALTAGREAAASPAALPFSYQKDSPLVRLADIVSRVWQGDGALEIVFHERAADVLRFSVTRCRYAEMYAELGIQDLGFHLSCRRDAAFAQGLDPAIVMRRSGTLMRGASHCDFHFTLSRPATPRAYPEHIQSI